jgi:NADH:ubiquinone oxidoreductase subunit 6 (subunit J)
MVSKRAVIAWYVAYGLVALMLGFACWWLVEQNRFQDACLVVLMFCGAIWVSASNHLDDELPPPDTGAGMDW